MAMDGKTPRKGKHDDGEELGDGDGSMGKLFSYSAVKSGLRVVSGSFMVNGCRIWSVNTQLFRPFTLVSLISLL